MNRLIQKTIALLTALLLVAAVDVGAQAIALKVYDGSDGKAYLTFYSLGENGPQYVSSETDSETGSSYYPFSPGATVLVSVTERGFYKDFAYAITGSDQQVEVRDTSITQYGYAQSYKCFTMPSLDVTFSVSAEAKTYPLNVNAQHGSVSLSVGYDISPDGAVASWKAAETMDVSGRYKLTFTPDDTYEFDPQYLTPTNVYPQWPSEPAEPVEYEFTLTNDTMTAVWVDVAYQPKKYGIGLNVHGVSQLMEANCELFNSNEESLGSMWQQEGEEGPLPVFVLDESTGGIAHSTDVVMNFVQYAYGYDLSSVSVKDSLGNAVESTYEIGEENSLSIRFKMPVMGAIVDVTYELHKIYVDLSSNAIDDDCKVEVIRAESSEEQYDEQGGFLGSDTTWATTSLKTGDYIYYGDAIKLVATPGANYSLKPDMFSYWFGPQEDPEGFQPNQAGNSSRLYMFDVVDTIHIVANFLPKEYNIHAAPDGTFFPLYNLDDNGDWFDIEESAAVAYGSKVNLKIMVEGGGYDITSIALTDTISGKAVDYEEATDENGDKIYTFTMKGSVNFSWEAAIKEYELLLADGIKGGTVELFTLDTEGNRTKSEDMKYHHFDNLVLKAVPAEGFYLVDNDCMASYTSPEYDEEEYLQWEHSETDPTEFFATISDARAQYTITSLGFMAKEYAVSLTYDEVLNDKSVGTCNVFDYSTLSEETFRAGDEVEVSVTFTENSYKQYQLGEVAMTLTKEGGETETFTGYEVVDRGYSSKTGWGYDVKFTMPAGSLSINVGVADRLFNIAVADSVAGVSIEVQEAAAYGDTVIATVKTEEGVVLANDVIFCVYTVDYEQRVERIIVEDGVAKFPMWPYNITLKAETTAGEYPIVMNFDQRDANSLSLSYASKSSNGGEQQTIEFADGEGKATYADEVSLVLTANAAYEMDIEMVDGNGNPVTFEKTAWDASAAAEGYRMALNFVMPGSSVTVSAKVIRSAYVVLGELPEGVSLSLAADSKVDSVKVTEGDTVSVYPVVEEGYNLNGIEYYPEGATSWMELLPDNDGNYSLVASEGRTTILAYASKDANTLRLSLTASHYVTLEKLTVGNKTTSETLEPGQETLDLEAVKYGKSEYRFNSENAVEWGDTVSMVVSMEQERYIQNIEAMNRIYEFRSVLDGGELEQSEWLDSQAYEELYGVFAAGAEPKVYKTVSFVMPRQMAYLRLYPKHIDLEIAEADNTSATYVGNSWAAIAESVNDTTEDVAAVTTVALANDISYEETTVDYDTATYEGLAASADIQTVAPIEKEDISIDGAGKNVSNLSYIGTNIINQIGKNASVKRLSFENATLITTIDGTSFLITQDTVYVSVLSKSNLGKVLGFGFAGRVVIDYSQIPAELIAGKEIVKCLVGQNEPSGEVRGFFFDTDVQDADSIGNRQCISIKQNLGIGRNMGSAKVATNGNSNNKALNSGTDLDADRFQQQEVVFSNEEFKSGIVAAWLNYAGKGFGGEFTGEWAQGLRYPIQATVVDGVSNAVYRIAYQTNDTASVVDAPDFQSGGRTVTITTLKKPESVTVTNAEVVSSSDTETVIRLSGTGEPSVNISFLKSLEDALVVVEANQTAVSVDGRNISITNGEAEVYNLSGVLVGRVSAGSPIAVKTQGLYVVKAGQKSFLVTVKD